jgi:Undecaprenyl-phosphate glucose phosphotransferase
VGSILAVLMGLGATLYVRIYIAPNDHGAYEVSQAVWVLFLVLNITLTYSLRQLMREVFERRWRSGIGLRRVLIAGSGELGRLVADKIIEHRELGYQIVGFVDDKATGDHLGYRGLPLLGTIDQTADIAAHESVDHLYVALPPEQHVRMIELLDITSRECIDVKVVPDLLQVIALRARLEDLDGVPVININEPSLQGVNALVKRAIDIMISSAALLVLALPIAVIAALVRLTSRGPAFFRQERMGLDGKSFSIVKFRSMHDDAEKETGPVWTQQDDPRVTAFGRFLRRSNLDELPQLWNVFRGDMSIVGPRPERPHFVEQFKHRIPQYMLRHKVKAGLTGWAQVNGWRGNTAIDKRIEYDLYYIENWSVRLDLKIMWLTIVKGFFHKHAY